MGWMRVMEEQEREIRKSLQKELKSREQYTDFQGSLEWLEVEVEGVSIYV